MSGCASTAGSRSSMKRHRIAPTAVRYCIAVCTPACVPSPSLSFQVLTEAEVESFIEEEKRGWDELCEDDEVIRLCTNVLLIVVFVRAATGNLLSSCAVIAFSRTSMRTLKRI